MDEKNILKLTRDQWIEKLKIGQHNPGTLEEMKIRLRKFSLHPKLYQRLKLKAQREYKFECSLDPNEVPSISAKWCLDEKFYPAVNEDILTYCSFKHPRNKGQQEKALRMLQSRKIVSVKTLRDNSGIYIRGMIKKILWYNSQTSCCKATCRCPVGLSEVCCHILALLLFLKQYTDTKEKY